MNDRLEPIRRVFRSATLYHHAADDLLCSELYEAMAPKPSWPFHKAEAAAREADTAVTQAIADYRANKDASKADSLHDKILQAQEDCVETQRDLLAALDAARGEAVLWLHRESGDIEYNKKPWMGAEWEPLCAAPPAALADASALARMALLFAKREALPTRAQLEVAAHAVLAQQPADAVPAANVTPMRQPRADLARLVESINAAVYANGDGLSVTEAIGALELAKLELFKEQEK